MGEGMKQAGGVYANVGGQWQEIGTGRMYVEPPPVDWTKAFAELSRATLKAGVAIAAVGAALDEFRTQLTRADLFRRLFDELTTSEKIRHRAMTLGGTDRFVALLVLREED